MIGFRQIAIGLSAALGVVAGGGCSNTAETSAQADEAAMRIVPITVASVEVRDVERTVEIVGTLRGWEEVTIGAKRAGRVITVRHDIGDRVAPGESLIELEKIDAELAVKQAERQLRADLAKLGLTSMPTDTFNIESIPAIMQTRVALEQSRRELNRVRSLQARNAASLQEVQDAEDAERSAAASYENAIVNARSTLAGAQATQVALQVAEQALEDTIIRAPSFSLRPAEYDGTMLYAVTGREVAEGQMLAAGESVMSLAIEDPLKLTGSVPERFVGEVQADQPVTIRVAAYDQTFEGRVTRINPSVDPVSRTFRIEAIVPNAQGRLRPGSFAKASIVTQRDDGAITVPLESIVSYAGVTKVFVIEDAKAREVQVATRLEDPEGRWIEVLGPLRPGDQVATSGMSQLAEGTPITIREPAISPGEAAPDTSLIHDPAQAETAPETERP